MSRVACRTLLLFLAASTLPALSQAGQLDDALRRCAGLNEDPARLACFDEIVRTLPQVEADRFGMTVEIERKRDPLMPQAKNDMIGGKIAELRQIPAGEWIFTLDNRQVWIEAEPRVNVEFAVGEDVRIEHGAMSSLWLVADQHRRVRVKRLR